MAITDNKIINGSGLSELSSQIKSYVNSKIVNEVYVGDTAPTDPKAKLWVDTSAEPSNNSYTKSEIDTKLTQKQDTLTPGDNITIVNGVISSTASGSAEPDAYIKDASVSGNTLTLTKKDNTNVVFTPSSGSSDIKSYSFSTGSLTAEEIANLQYCVDNPTKVIFTINDIRIQNMYNSGIRWYFFGISYQGGNIQGFSYYIAATSAAITGTSLSSNYSGDIIITQSVIQNYLSSWQVVISLDDSNLYNARELTILFENSNGKCLSYYYNFNCSFDSAWDMGRLNRYANKNFLIQIDENQYGSWYYDGSQINFSGNSITNYRIFYKT